MMGLFLIYSNYHEYGIWEFDLKNKTNDFMFLDEPRINGDIDPSNTSKMQLQQQLSQQQQELLQQLQVK